MSEKTTFTGHRGLELREDLIFEIGAPTEAGSIWRRCGDT